MSGALLDVANVSKIFETGRRLWWRPTFKAVDGVSLEVRLGETLGIVGESGSGKSTLLRMMLRLIRPSVGTIRFSGRNIWTLSGGEMLALRRQIQAVFQDPASSFNPRHSIGALLSAPLEVHGIGTRESRRKTVADTLAASWRATRTSCRVASASVWPSRAPSSCVRR
jgi:ABC-type glutathione transport system ATPase component